MDFSRRPASPDDVDWLVELRIETMDGYLRESGEVLSPADQHARVVQDFDSIRILVVEGEDAGMIKTVKHEDRWHLVQIQVQPAQQGKGIGARVIEQLINEARAATVPVLLSVLKVNPAKRLYERLGFQVVEERDKSYRMRIV